MYISDSQTDQTEISTGVGLTLREVYRIIGAGVH